MANEEYKPNSFKSRETGSNDRKLAPVVKGKAEIKKRSAVNKVANTILSDDADNVGSYIINEVLIPTIKNTIVDAISMMILGETRNHRSSGKENYTRYYRSSNSRDKGTRVQTTRRSRYDFSNIIFDTRSDADDVYNGMLDVLEDYHFVTVADMYQLADMPHEYTDNNYGWDDLAGTYIERVREGYLLKLPKVIAID